ncbi:MAG: hypothetical protein ACF8R7_01960 [Phycisphaerales bacterium JB039]
MNWTHEGVVVCAVLVIGQSALGDVKYFRPSGSSAAWSDNVWYDSEVGGSLVASPDEGDRAVILAGKKCNLTTNEAADTLELRSTATLEIQSGKTLTLDNDDSNANGAANSEIDGLIDLITDATLKFIDQDHGFEGDGEVAGDDEDCTIDIDDELLLTNRLAVGGFTGAMTILGQTGTNNGEFRNDGLVVGSGGTEDFVLASTTELSDHNTVDQAVWKADGGSLIFKRDAQDLDGNMVVECKSLLRFEADVKTCGTFTWTAGTWEVDTDQTFKYVTYSSGSANPGTDLCPNERCDCLKWGITGSDSGTIICP